MSYLDNIKTFSELHLHLDGSISVNNLKQLAKLENMPVPSDEEINGLLTVSDNCKDLNEYLEKFDYPCSFLQTKEQLSLAIYNLLEELKNAGYIYAEIRFAPQLHLKKGLSQDDVVKSVIAGMNKASLKANLILCAMRNKGNEKENLETARLVGKYLNKGVVCLDLAGAEGLFPTADFKYLFDFANENQIPFIIHAGEADGPDSVWKALEFGADRIGHGVRSLEDEHLVDDLVKNKIPLEVCPKSNIDTGMFESLKAFPLRKMLDLGLNVAISSDNISVSNGNVISVFNKLIAECDITKEDVERMLLNSINSSYLSEKEKLEFVEMIKNDFNK